jgi:dolichyl-phosphate beta-glucosyltransferase
VELSVIIPLYNEEKRISQTISVIADYLKRNLKSYEIILVNDGSTDNTLLVIKKIQEELQNIVIIENQKNKGKGYSIRRGVLEVKGKYILFSDADLSTPIEEIERLMPKLEEGFNIAIGSRGLPDSRILLHQGKIRENMGRIFGFIVRKFIGLKIRDTQCGFKLFPKKVANLIFREQTINGFSFDVEFLLIAKEKGLRIAEVPIVWRDSNESKVNIFTEPVKMLRDLIRIKWKHLRKNYSQN